MTVMNWGLTVTLASLHARSNNMDAEQVPGIKMRPLTGYDYDAVLQGEIYVRDVSNFKTMFPDIIRDKQPDWFLFGVHFQVDILELQYVCRKPYPGYRGSTLYPTAYIKVRSPANLGLKFDVPRCAEYTRRRYKLKMRRTTNANGTERTLWLKEKYPDTGAKHKIKISSHLPPQTKS